jgi:hypothetical protein
MCAGSICSRNMRGRRSSDGEYAPHRYSLCTAVINRYRDLASISAGTREHRAPAQSPAPKGSAVFKTVLLATGCAYQPTDLAARDEPPHPAGVVAGSAVRVASVAGTRQTWPWPDVAPRSSVKDVQ